MKYKCQYCKLDLDESHFYKSYFKYEKNLGCIECVNKLRKIHKKGDKDISSKPNKIKAIKEVVESKPEVKFKSKTSLIEYYAKHYSIEREYGYVYVIGVKGKDFDAPVKIGYTNSSVKNRLSQLNSSHWEDLYVIYHSMEIPWAKKMEKYLHDKFANQRVNREWFHLGWDHFDDLQEEMELPFIREELLEEFILLQETQPNSKDRMNELGKQFENTFSEVTYLL